MILISYVVIQRQAKLLGFDDIFEKNIMEQTFRKI